MLKQPYLLFLGDACDRLAAKSAVGVWQWRAGLCVGQVRLDGCQVDLPVPVMSVEEGAAAGAMTLIIGVANAGGVISDAWLEPLSRALAAGLDLANGLHDRLADQPRLVEMAARHGRKLIDVRHPAARLQRRHRRAAPRPASADGRHRLLGRQDVHDAGAGEGDAGAAVSMPISAPPARPASSLPATGVCVDAVIADFMSGAIEWLAPAAAEDHWDLIEGQGSLFHPSFAGVSLGLLHGAQADALVMCHEPTRTHMRGLPHRPLPELGACIEAISRPRG